MARWNPGRLAVEVIAAVFVVAGVLGLASGGGSLAGPLTTGDAVHLALGFAGLAAARSSRAARIFLISGGVVYFLWHYGGGAVVLTDGAAPITLTTVNDGLNLGLAVSMIALACLVGDRHRPVAASAGRAAELEVSWREARVPAAVPSARPRRPRPAAGSRPPAPGRDTYRCGI